MSLDIFAMAAKVRALGNEITPAAIEGTAKLYGPEHEREPYQGVKVSPRSGLWRRPASPAGCV